MDLILLYPLDQMGELVSLRPKVVLRENQILPLAGSDLGLHPELSDLRDLYNENRFQIIQNVGYPDQNFSHFRSTDIWMSGSSADTIESTGWMGRHLTEVFPDYPSAYPDNDMEGPFVCGNRIWLIPVVSRCKWFNERDS